MVNGVSVAARVEVIEDTLTADLSDGRYHLRAAGLVSPVVHATPTERRN